MKPRHVIITSWVCLGITLSPAAGADDRGPQRAGEPGALNAAEADAIVSERAAATRQRKRVRLAQMDARRAVSRKVIDKGARTVTMERIEPPAAGKPGAPTPVPVARIAFDEGGKAPAGKAPTKNHATLSISATVYDRAVTQIHWWAGGVRRTAFSNIDFSLLRGVSRAETDDTVFSFFMGIGESERRRRDAPAVPARGEFAGPASYIVTAPGDTRADREFLAGLDALHAHFKANERALRIADGRRRALAAASARYRAAHPGEPEDTVIQFWPKRGSAYGGE